MSSRVQLQPRVLVSVVEASLSARSAASTTASPISAYVEVEIPTFAQTRRTQAVPHTATPNWEHDQPDKSALMFAFPRTDDRISPATLSVVIRFAVYDEARVDAAGRRICYGKVDYALEQAVLTTVFDHTVALSQPTDAPPAPPSQLRFVVAFLDLKPLGDMHALHARRRREEGRQLESATRRIAGLEERARAFASDNDELKRHLAAAQLLSKEQSKELATLRGGGAAAGSSSSVSSAAAVAVETSSTSSAARVAQVEAEVIAHQLKLRETIKMLRKSLLHNAELKEMRRDLGAEVHQLRAELAESQRRALQLENERIEGRDGMSFARLEDLGLGHIAAELAEFIRAAERLGFDHAAADRLRGGVDGAMANPPLMDHSRAAGSAAKSAAEAALTTPRETVVVVKKLQTLTARVEQHGGDSEFAAASLQQMVERLNGELLPLLRECGGCMKDEDVALLLEMSVRDPHDQALRTRLVRKSSAVLRDWMAQKGDADAAEVRLRSCRANDAQGSDIFLASDSHRKFIDRLAKLVSSAKREVDVRTQRRMETERELNLISSGARNKVAAWKKSIFASMAAEDEARSQRLRQQREIRDTVRGIEGELEKAREGYQQHCLVEKVRSKLYYLSFSGGTICLSLDRSLKTFSSSNHFHDNVIVHADTMSFLILMFSF